MLKFYSIAYKTYNNGTYIDTHYATTLKEESEIKNDLVFINWDNLSEMYHKYNLSLPFNIWNFKKGRLVSFFDGRLFDKNTWDVKEWKEELNIEVKVYHIERNATLEDLKHFDVVKVKKYLDERVDK